MAVYSHVDPEKTDVHQFVSHYPPPYQDMVWYGTRIPCWPQPQVLSVLPALEATRTAQLQLGALIRLIWNKMSSEWCEMIQSIKCSTYTA